MARTKNFWKIVNHVIRNADVLLMLLDARFVDETRNREIEEKVRSLRKPLIYVITKADLVPKKKLEQCKRSLSPSVFVSAKDRSGRDRLKESIIREANRFYGSTDRINIGVLGYPNVGKSSLINMLKGRHSASTSSISGHTKKVQLLKIDRKLYFIDTPGVLPYMEKDDVKHAFTNVMDYRKAKDPDLLVISMMRRMPGVIEAYYGVPIEEDKEKTLETIALKRHVLKKGGIPDVVRMSIAILKDIQADRIRLRVMPES